MSDFTLKSMQRRDFLCRMSMLTGAAFVSSIVPVPSFAVSSVVRHWRATSPTAYTDMDEALGNYPSYSENIGAGCKDLLEPAANYVIDPQLDY